MNKRLTFKLGESNPSYGLEDKASAKPGLFTDYDGFYAFLLATRRLGQYEDIFFDENGNERITPAEVAELVQAKADGRVVALPCKVGDTVWAYCDYFQHVAPYKVDMAQLYGHNSVSFCANCKDKGELMDDLDFDTGDIGKTVFLTREEAEKALKECEK